MRQKDRENRRLQIVLIVLISALLALLGALIYRNKKAQEEVLKPKPFDGHISIYDEDLGRMSLNPWGGN